MATLPTYHQENQTITFNDPAKLQLTVITPAIIRVFENRGEPDDSYAIEGDKQQATEFKFNQVANHYELITAALTLHIDKSLHIDAYDPAGNPLVTDYRGTRTPLDRGIDEAHKKFIKEEGHNVPGANDQDNTAYYEVVKRLAADESIYGLGDKTGYMNKRGYEYDNWNTDDPAPHLENFTRLYKSVPVMFGLKDGHPYGLFFDNPYRSHFDLGKESANYYFYSAEAGNLDYYIIGGKTLKDVVSNYTYLTGRTPLPQKWTLGYQQSRWGYSATQKMVQGIVDDLHKYDLPFDVIHLDIDYMRDYRVFTWNDDAYQGNPKKFVTNLKNQGTKIVAIIDPGVKKDPGYNIYDEGIKHDYFVKRPDGNVYVNQVWPGDSVFPDFGRQAVRDWWANNDQFLTDLGVAGIWNDMNEPASFVGEIPQDIVFSDHDRPSTHKKMHNVYAHNMDQATYASIKRATDRRPFVITRAAYSGTQKYATVWTGDNHSIWPHVQLLIPQLCNLGMSGFSFSGTDIGGFGSDVTPELLTRWIEAAIFSPLLRNHSAMGTRDQEPWQFGEPTLSIYRKYLKLRYRFIPYLYDLFAKEERSGLPLMRPLVLNYPEDRRVHDINDQYMVGDSVLVAPIVQPSQTKRLVYLPKGDWVDFWNHQEYSGQQDIVVDAPLDKLPLFIKKNTILPWGEEVDHISEQPDQQMTFTVYGHSGNYHHYQDDGLDFNYRNGEYNDYQIVVEDDHVSVRLTHHGFAPVYQRIVVELPDQLITLNYNSKTETYQ
ncbi:glycoside hydrolase family 31 protein [Lentilactobacillus parabuchneri]|uniref:glycoside hydrolase family 31 protein n=1 Tax=Lentilactobacillus parabuchneri TaxID=152331 RepID=UPI00230812BD|nr:glycoside hydrolase family 31 protein [Lentilactobacillus parabuchneri]MDB1104333.1 glycoside hydrolase family 31 protein [Lentilactobacillus parabuchneri]